MVLSKDEIDGLQKVADLNDGHCDRCHRVISIYKYRVNEQMAQVLRAMAAEINDSGTNRVNFDDFDLPYRLKSQRTKMRLHGLIAKVKDGEGAHIKNTWLITTKGGDFLRGQPIPCKVIVFDNQVLGHEGGTTTIKRLMGEMEVERKPITTPEAAAYSNIRKPKRNLHYSAQYVGHTYNPGGYQTNAHYELEIKQLVVGNPVVILAPFPRTYASVAKFQEDWKIEE